MPRRRKKRSPASGWPSTAARKRCPRWPRCWPTRNCRPGRESPWKRFPARPPTRHCGRRWTKCKARLLVGVINSIGVRRDAEAVESLAARLKDRDAEVASAAAVALGRIGNAAAATALEAALAGSGSRGSLGGGRRLYSLCGEASCRRQGRRSDQRFTISCARPTCPSSESARRPAAQSSRGKPQAYRFWSNCCARPTSKCSALRLTVARELPGKETADVLAAELAKATPERQSLLIVAIADRGDATALPAVLQAAKSGPDSVKVTVVKVLRRLGDASSVPLLLELADEREPRVGEDGRGIARQFGRQGCRRGNRRTSVQGGRQGAAGPASACGRPHVDCGHSRSRSRPPPIPTCRSACRP